MKYLALYRKYRPDNFDDLVGQKQVVKVVNNAIINNKLSHAYLFSGPRGTGKTSTAKIISKMVNCLNFNDGKPCGKCSNCINSNSNDIIEIDAASNNGIDEIRDLKEKINLVPNNGKYKIYIIDEVHMLTIQAFNALLKTLEEPPNHVIFILATTELNKIPLTISSRCQKFLFNKISDVDISNRLLYIAKQEKINITEDAAFEIAKIADGGLRDAINFLDELSVYNNGFIDINDVDSFSGAVSYSSLLNFIKNLKEKKYTEIVTFIDSVEEEGKSLNKFLEQLIEIFKNILVFKNCGILTQIVEENNILENLKNEFSDDMIYKIIYELNELKNKINNTDFVKILFVVSIFKICSFFPNLDYNSDNKIKQNDNNDICDKINLDVKKNCNSLISSCEYLDNQDIKINNCFVGAKKQLLINFSFKWSNLVEYITDDKFQIIAGLLNDVVPVLVSEEYVVLCTKFDSVCDRLYYNYSLLKEFISYVYKKKYDIIILLDSKWNKIKEEYIKKIKSGYKFEIIEYSNETKNNNNCLLDKLADLVGNDKIEFN